MTTIRKRSGRRRILKRHLKTVYQLLPFKRHAYAVLRRFYTPPPWLYQHLHFKGPIRVKCEDREFLIHHHGLVIENDLFWRGLTGAWERVSLELWIKLCRNADTILDIGANTGVYSLVAKTVNPDAIVYGFEPVRRIYERLRYNCQLNAYDIRCVDCALSNYDGEAVIYDTDDFHSYTVTINRNPHDKSVATHRVPIRARTLRSFIESENLKTVDLVKLDVEGHEPQVLEGAGRYLEQMKPTMLIEVLSQDNARRIENLVHGLGYLYFDIDETDPPRQAHTLGKSGCFNYLLCDRPTAENLGLIRCP